MRCSSLRQCECIADLINDIASILLKGCWASYSFPKILHTNGQSCLRTSGMSMLSTSWVILLVLSITTRNSPLQTLRPPSLMFRGTWWWSSTGANDTPTSDMLQACQMGEMKQWELLLLTSIVVNNSKPALLFRGSGHQNHRAFTKGTKRLSSTMRCPGGVCLKKYSACPMSRCLEPLPWYSTEKKELHDFFPWSSCLVRSFKSFIVALENVVVLFIGPIVITRSCVDNVVLELPHVFHSSKSLIIAWGPSGSLLPLKNSSHNSLYLYQ